MGKRFYLEKNQREAVLKKFKDFNKPVAMTRVYALRLEALDAFRENPEYIIALERSYTTPRTENYQKYGK